MPAAAVIPAPVAYIKAVAVKKLVVGFWETGTEVRASREYFRPVFLPSGCSPLFLIEWRSLGCVWGQPCA